ncbi:ABC transporter substrate-binding protein [Moorena sp. SIOASIH]|uniref:ABC transporter substrate-binding protein n=1 Tax=Moorena sp. SIOASIH TaxID=2607817 RepID=UPI0026004AD3|nr:ABC transporter substrate-binding protein [Moorena sp. SIOASIH]
MLSKQIYDQLKLLGLIVLSLFLSLLLVLGSGFSGKSQEPDIVLGMSAAFTGASRSLGIELYRGSMAYIEDINRQGGINGKQIVIQAYDDGYNPTRAIQNSIKLIENDDVFLLFDYVGTPTVTRVLPLLKNYSDRQTYLFFPFTGAQPQREAPYEQFAFNLRASYRQETEGLVDNFVKINRRRIAVFYQIDAYGRSGWDGVRRSLAKYGLSIVGEATYRRGTSYSQSLRRQVDILRAANPDAVISIGSYGACAALIRDARDAGWNVPIANISFVGSESLLNLLLETGVKTGIDYTTNLINSQVVPSYNDISLPGVSDYRALMDQYNPMPPRDLSSAGYKPLRYSFVSLEGFLNAKLLVAILKMMGDKVDKARLRQAVEKVKNLDLGINAPVSFSAFRNQGLNNVYYTTVEQGQFVPLDRWERWAK